MIIRTEMVLKMDNLQGVFVRRGGAEREDEPGSPSLDSPPNTNTNNLGSHILKSKVYDLMGSVIHGESCIDEWCSLGGSVHL